MGIFRLAEHFISINGEGQRAGELALFLRFTGCNLHCSYCDTRWVNEKDAPYTLKSTKELLSLAADSDIQNVTLTGGEPLLQSDLPELIQGLMLASHQVEIETNGAVAIAPILEKMTVRPSFTMDYKLPSSGMESRMCTNNFQMLTHSDTVKFVCGSQEDLYRAGEIIRQYELMNCTRVYFSPVFGQIDPKDMVEFMKQNRLNRARLQLQLHKFIWDPNEKGV